MVAMETQRHLLTIADRLETLLKENITEGYNVILHDLYESFNKAIQCTLANADALNESITTEIRLIRQEANSYPKDLPMVHFPSSGDEDSLELVKEESMEKETPEKGYESDNFIGFTDEECKEDQINLLSFSFDQSESSEGSVSSVAQNASPFYMVVSGNTSFSNPTEPSPLEDKDKELLHEGNEQFIETANIRRAIVNDTSCKLGLQSSPTKGSNTNFAVLNCSPIQITNSNELNEKELTVTEDKISESTLGNPLEGVLANEKQPNFDKEHGKERDDHNPADKIHLIEHEKQYSEKSVKLDTELKSNQDDSTAMINLNILITNDDQVNEKRIVEQRENIKKTTNKQITNFSKKYLKKVLLRVKTGKKISKQKASKGANEIQNEEQTIEMECKATSMVEFSDKTWKCSRCDYTTIYKQSLRRHIITVHTKIKMFECTDCVATFGRKDHLNRHLIVAHGNAKKFECFECSMAFGRIDYLKNHIRDSHKSKIIE